MNPLASLFEKKNDENRSRKAPRHPIPTTSRFIVNTRKVEDALSIKLGQVVGAVLTTIKFLQNNGPQPMIQGG